MYTFFVSGDYSHFQWERKVRTPPILFASIAGDDKIERSELVEEQAFDSAQDARFRSFAYAQTKSAKAVVANSHHIPLQFCIRDFIEFE